MANIIDGKAVSAQVKENIRLETEKLREQGIEIGLAVVIVGNDPASQVYVRNKEKACETVGFNSYKYALPEETTEEELLALVDKLNNDDKVDGILVQLPLPKHLDDKIIINNIRPDKDVDAFHPINVGKIMIGEYSFLPCTPAGVMELIKSTGTEIAGKECVVIGRSNIVGKPQAMLLLHQSGTVKPGAVVIDVGMNRDENGKLCGDVDFESVKDKAGYITPVPGGVGPMTIAMLMQNTLTAGKEHHGVK